MVMPRVRCTAAVIQAVEPGQDLHQSRFACAIRADQSRALVGSNEPVGIFKEEFGAEPFAGAGKLQHSLF